MAKRRDNGDGTIYHRKDGRWEARILLPDGRTKYFYGHKKEEVRKRLDAARRDIQQGLPVVSTTQTVEEFLTGGLKPGDPDYPGGWLAAIASTVRPRTFVGYENYVRLHIVPMVGRIALAMLSPQDLQRLYAKKWGENLSSTTVSHIHATIHRALTHALRWELVRRNVADYVDPPKRHHHEVTALSPQEAHRLLRAASGDRLEALYVLAVATGMRQGELLGLRWRHVDLDKTKLHVRATLQRVTKRTGAIAALMQPEDPSTQETSAETSPTRATELTFGEPKTAKSRRTIVLPPIAVNALKQHRARQAEERLAMGAGWHDEDLVFPNQNGKPIEASNLRQRSFKPLLKKAHLPDIPFHALRHTAATLLLQTQTHPKVVSDMLGHSRSGITLDIYSHVLPNMQEEAAMAMERILGGNSLELSSKLSSTRAKRKRLA